VKPDGSVEAMRRRVAHEFATMTAIHERMSARPGFGAVRPVACYVEQLCVVTERAEGDTLLELMHRRARWFPSPATRRQLAFQLEAVGQWLKAFQSADTDDRRVSPVELVEYVDVRLKRLVSHLVVTASMRQGILEHLRGLAAEVPAADLREVTLHGDLAPANVLVAGERVVVLDFAMVSRGSYLHDISRLHMQLGILQAKPSFRPFVIRDLQAALLRGFGLPVAHTHPLFRLLCVLHRINHFGTLSLRPEGLASSVMSGRVRRLHLGWLDEELRARRVTLQT
jgi:aminoglycoside phosphotransferase (APT) family kinase protein